MVWARLCDTLHAHMKTRRAGLEAMGLWAVSMSWSSQQLTDGFVPGWFVESWPKGRALARKLVNAGLWEEAPPVDEQGKTMNEKGWVFHDWEDHNPTRDEVEDRRKLARDRQRRHRQAVDRTVDGRFQARNDGTPTPSVTRDDTRDSRVLSHRPDPTRPVPSPGRTSLRGDSPVSQEAADPPSFADHCEEHWNVAVPGPCGSCADARKASRKLTAVPEGYCLVHDQRYWSACNGCAADAKAAQ